MTTAAERPSARTTNSGPEEGQQMNERSNDIAALEALIERVPASVRGMYARELARLRGEPMPAEAPARRYDLSALMKQSAVPQAEALAYARENGWAAVGPWLTLRIEADALVARLAAEEAGQS